MSYVSTDLEQVIFLWEDIHFCIRSWGRSCETSLIFILSKNVVIEIEQYHDIIVDQGMLRILDSKLSTQPQNSQNGPFVHEYMSSVRNQKGSTVLLLVKLERMRENTISSALPNWWDS